jgi:hypothetical protein
LSLSALSASCTERVYRYLEQRTLNLVTVPVFLIFTDRASFRRAVRRKSLISLICLGCTATQWSGATRGSAARLRTPQDELDASPMLRLRAALPLLRLHPLPLALGGCWGLARGCGRLSLA